MNGITEKKISRRGALGAAALAAGAAALPFARRARAFVETPDFAAEPPEEEKGSVNQSIAYWCFNENGEKWDIEQTCRVARDLGCKSVELCGPEDYATVRAFGLTCALAPNGMPGAPFVKGLNNMRYHNEVIGRTMEAMDICEDFDIPNVIAFNGYKWEDAENPESEELSLEEGAENCVRALKELARHGERRGVTVCLEMLNTRDDTHPMKGHPGYQGDNLDYVLDIVKEVSSPRVKLLFDIYHVQVMHGDVIRRIGECAEYIGHVHTAGNPGRGELDMNQEINFPAIVRKLVEIKYEGYVGHEFIPTRDPFEGLHEAVRLCDV